MSGSLTVIGGHTGGVSTGLVNIPMDQSALTLTGLGLQNELTSISGAVTTGAASFYNNDLTGGTVDAATGSTSIGVYELTNTDSTGAVTAGTVSGSFVVPTGFNTLVVQAPGDETITGNGSSNFLAIFSSQSTVNFSSTGDGNVSSGTGTIIASTNNFIDVGGTYGNGQGWSIVGGATGGDTINTTAENTAITTAGSGNLIGLAGIFSTVVAGGTGDLIGGIGGLNTISVTGASVNAVIMGGSDTIYATAGSTNLNAFFAGNGGLLDFVNQSSVAASVTGSFGSASGSLTVFGGEGGGYFQGGNGGNNSLVGGVGTSSSTVIGAGNNNFLSVDGSGHNALFADALSSAAGGGSATLVAGSGTNDNDLVGGTGSESLVSYGSGSQNFFVGNSGSETITGSNTGGALNQYYFTQGTLSGGGGTDVITDFRYGTDQGFINAFGVDSTFGSTTISGVDTSTTNGVTSTQISLSDNTIIKLVGVSITNGSSLIGGTHF